MARSACRLIVLLAALAVPERLFSQPAFLVKDLDIDGSPPINPAAELTVVGTHLFFTYDDGLHGAELWRSDGTTAGTALLIDLCPGICPSKPRSLTALDGVLFFVADDGERGAELWKSDGTAAGTVLIKDIHPGTDNPLPVGSPGGLLAMDGAVYFAADDGEHGQELWKSDGTPEGTVLVRDIHPGPNGSSPRPWEAGDGILLLNADDGSHGREPWVSDGTTAGTVMTKDIHAGVAPSSAEDFDVSINGQDVIALPGGGFAFRADDGSHGPELWKTDGTEAGTVLIRDILPFASGSDPVDLVVLGSTVYFTATDDGFGRRLWKTDGTEAGTTLVEDIGQSPVAANPSDLVVSGGRLFFRASDVDHGFELWSSDGTSTGTRLVKDTVPGDFPGLILKPAITPFGGGVLFFRFGADLWRSDGTETGTVPVPGVYLPPAVRYLFPKTWTVAGSSFFFSTLGEIPPFHQGLATSDGGSAHTLLTSESTATSSLRSLNFAVPVRRPFVEQGQQVLFTADPGNGVSGLWASDATPAGTLPLLFSSSDNLTPAGGFTFLTAGFNFVKTDGTPAGTQTLSSLSPTGEIAALGSSVLYPCGTSGLCGSDGTPAGTGQITSITTSVTPFQLTVSMSNVFFVAGDESPGKELWKSDGTVVGTLLVRDFWIDGDSSPDRLTDVAGTLFFSAATQDEGRELWKSDGTEEGTVLIKDIRPGQASSIQKATDWAGFTVAVGGTLFFVADDGISGSELWKSDGTAAGTVLVKDIAQGSPGSSPFWLTRVGNRVYFAANDGTHGRELWVSDGTAAGTRMVEDIFPGERSSVPQNLQALGHILLFAATDGAHGLEAWRSNGTAAGTRMIQDIAPGALPSSPKGFTSAGMHVFFAANDGATGFEPWAMPRAAALATFGDVPPSYWAYPFIEAIASSSITGGCGGGNYCPESSLTRAEMAVFLLLSAHGPSFFPPPATGQVFADVAADSFAASWIERLKAEGYTSGCGGGNFCPSSSLNRAEMAVFLLLLRHGIGYTPPPATGLVFGDVPASSPFAPWIEQLFDEGVTGGCGEGNYCPNNAVTRAQMAVFLATTLNLPLGQD